MEERVVGYGTDDILKAAAEAVRAKVEAENALLAWVAAWADANSADSIHPDELKLAGGPRGVRVGGEGTPEVNDLAVEELAVKIKKSDHVCTKIVGEVLDLRHRLQLLWEKTMRCEVEGWQARSIARQTRHLTVEQARQVDEDLAGVAGLVGYQKLQNKTEAAIARVDGARLNAVAAERKKQLGVWLSQTSDEGLKGLFARLEPADAVRLFGRIQELADALPPDDRSPDERRAAGLALLANELEATRVLAEYRQPDLFGEEFAAAVQPIIGEVDVPIEESELHPSLRDVPVSPWGDPTFEPAGPMPGAACGDAMPAKVFFDAAASDAATCDAADDTASAATGDATAATASAGSATAGSAASGSATAGSATAESSTSVDKSSGAEMPSAAAAAPTSSATAAALRRAGFDLAAFRAAVFKAAVEQIVAKLDPARLLPTSTLVVHIAAETLENGHGICRVPGIGPTLKGVVKDWLGHDKIKVVPVIDLNDTPAPVDEYQIPDRHKRYLRFARPGSRFPWSTATGRLEFDHTQPYRSGGPPGQTDVDKLAPYAKREHRAVTFGGWQRRQPEPDTLIFKSPHGDIQITNYSGTFDLGRGAFAHAVWTAADPSA